MDIRTLLALLVCAVVVGCQTPPFVLFPWALNESLTQLSEQELSGLEQDLASSPEVFGLATGEEVGTTGVLSESLAENTLADEWVRQGRQAIRKAGQSPQRDVLLSDAMYAFRQALKIDPDNSHAYHGMAIVADLTQDWSMAEYNYKKALAPRQQDANLLNDIGYSYLLQNRYHEAAQYLNRAVQVDPRYEKSHVNLAILDIRCGDHAAAHNRLAQLYPPEQAQKTLASLTGRQQNDTNGSQLAADPAHQLIHLSASSVVGGPERAAGSTHDASRQTPFRQTQRTQYAVPQSLRRPGPAIDPQSQTSEFFSGNHSPPLFDASGVIQLSQGAHAGALDGPSAPTENTPAKLVAPATLTHPASPTSTDFSSRTSSVLEGARAVGGSLTLSSGIESAVHNSTIPPSISTPAARGVRVAPANVNVHSGLQPYTQLRVQPWSLGAVPQLNAAPHSQAWGQQQAATAAFNALPGAPAALPRNKGYQLPVHIWPQHLHGAPAATAGSSGFQNAAGYSASAMLGPRIALGFSEASAFGNPAAGVSGQVPENAFDGCSIPGTTDPYYQPDSVNGVSYGLPNLTGVPQTQQPEMAGSSQSVAGAVGQVPDAVTPFPTAASLAPPQIIPPSVRGPGHQAGGVNVPDPLEEYRATRRQQENDYNRVIQQINPFPAGGAVQ